MKKIVHGHAVRGQTTREYIAYGNAQKRCTNPDSGCWEYYGGRGIQFKFKSFQEFLACLGPRPAGTSLDRIDNDGHYEAGNVRWATPLEQSKNKRKRKPWRVHLHPSHCRWGHALDVGNVYTDKLGRRNCRTCARNRGRASYRLKVTQREK